MHGFALNICMDLSGFERIVACGISDCHVCNLNQFLPNVDFVSVKKAIAQTFAEIFNLEIQLQEIK